MVGRIFENCKEAISEIQRDLFEMGVEVHTQTMQNKDIANDEGYGTKELQCYSFCILDAYDKMDIVTEDSKEWVEAEFAERIKGWDDKIIHKINPGEAWKLRSHIWTEFLNGDGKFCYTYNERMAWQIKAVLEELKVRPETRQAIIELHDRSIDQDHMGKIRVPCSMYYQLMIRNGKLDIVYNMRSTDFFTHFKNDIYLACKLRDWYAEELGLKTGKFFMYASSLHAYKKDFPDGVF